MKVLPLALATMMTLGVSAPSIASEVPTEELEALVWFESKGGTVLIDSELCEETGAMGIATTAGPSIHICTEPHRGDGLEVADTIRHELWHIAQFCHGSPIGQQPAAQIAKAHAEGWTTRGYEPNVWHMEAEAHWVAATQDVEFIKGAITRFCF